MVSVDWQAMLNIFITGVLAYIAIIIFIRLSGKRTLSQLNAFDFIVTVALGSVLSNVLLSKNTPLLQGLFGFGLLVLLQFGVAWLSVRVGIFSRLLKSEPRLLYYQGQFKSKAMRQERVKKEEMLQSVRSEGLLSLEQVEAIVLETNGTFSIIKSNPDKAPSALENINLE